MPHVHMVTTRDGVDVQPATEVFPGPVGRGDTTILLPDGDIRQLIDESVRRGWGEFFRRAARVGVLYTADLGVSSIAAFLALALARRTGDYGTDSIAADNAFIILVSFAAFIQPLAMAAAGAYDSGDDRVAWKRIIRGIGLTVLAGWLLVATVGSLTAAELRFDGITVLAYAGLCVVFIGFARHAIDSMVQFAYRRGWARRRVIVVGDDQDLERMIRATHDRAGADLEIVGHISLDRISAAGSGRARDLLGHALRKDRAGGVILGAPLATEMFTELVRSCFDVGANVLVIPKMIEQVGNVGIQLRRSGSGMFLQLAPQTLRVPQLALKRSLDLLLATIGTVIVAPLMLLIAIAIKLDSPGPVFFVQERAGVGGRPFRMFKFRTMVANADSKKKDLQHLNESGDPRLFKIKNDPRVTRVGGILRKTSLDELPQLFNVIKGEMSLVGPRPFFPDDLRSYETHHFERLHVLPGITGLWQVKGRSDIVDFEEVVRLDREYIRNWSIFLDISILVRTIPAAFGRGGAY